MAENQPVSSVVHGPFPAIPAAAAKSETRSSILDDADQLDELVAKVVDRIERRVVDELERRGRRHNPGVF